MPIKSAKSPALSAYLILVIPTLPKYSVITYSVVSVLPCIVEASLPAKESGPKFRNISTIMTSEADPLIGLSRAIGNILEGMFGFIIGVKNENM